MKYYLLLLAIATVLSTGYSVAQDQVKSNQTTEQETSDGGKDLSLFDLYSQGGAVMHFIALCSAGTIAVSVFCALQINKARIAPSSLVNHLNQMVSQHQIDDAYQLCKSAPNPYANTAAAVLAKADPSVPKFNKPSMETAAVEVIDFEETKLGLWINYLNVFATIAPMLGLLGTVMGMIEAFNELAAGRSEPDDLAGGIGQAMVTTAGGLIVGIPAMFCYFFFRNMLQSSISQLQKSITIMIDILTGEIDASGKVAPSGSFPQLGGMPSSYRHPQYTQPQVAPPPGNTYQ
ncbi:MAG: MotA/TolQ/ExbB proton channel family protein [Verrucomicrobiota bacterium]